MINFFLYCINKMNFSGSPKGTPHDWCRRTMKKDYFAMKTNGIRWSSSKNDDEYFHWGPIFYVCSSARNWVSSMYKGIYHIRNSLWGVATVDVWSSSTRTFQQKNRSPEIINFFLYCIKKMFLQAHRRVPPTTGVVELWKKIILQWKPMELDGLPQKNDDYFHWEPIFYVCSSARNWVSSMYKGKYHIRNSLWGVATVDVWSSSTRTFQQKKQVPRNEQFLFILYWKNEFFRLTEGYPHDWCRRTMKKDYFAMKTIGIRWCSSKKWWLFSLGTSILCM